MTSLSFSLSPLALGRFHDSLICLSKFSDTVAIEADHDLLRLSALNSTKTAFASFICEKKRFFESYSFSMRNDTRSLHQSQGIDRFYCQILLKAFLSVFRGRSDRNKDTAVERCDIEISEDPQQTECRMTVKMVCGLGVIKSYKLTYEAGAIQHAVFDRSTATNQWTADPRFLRQIIDHFSLSAEQLDMSSNAERALFTSFTTKIMEGKEILKYPVHTSVAADKRDFENFLVQDNMHIAISLKDFKAVVAHAETANATVTALYTRPCKPLQLAYEFEGVSAEFTIMTHGDVDSQDESSTTRTTIQRLSSRSTPAPASISVSRTNGSRANTQNTQMPPPPSRSRSIRPLTGTSTQEHLSQKPAAQRISASTATPDNDSLFVAADDDRLWDEVNEEEPQDILGWDATGDQGALEPTLREAEPDFPIESESRNQPTMDDDMAIQPTQRMSQVRGLGLFD